MNTNEEMVEVTIQAFERVEYYQTVKMKKTEFDRLDKMLDSNDRREQERAQDEIQGWIDTRNICDVDRFKLEYFGIAEYAEPAG